MKYGFASSVLLLGFFAQMDAMADGIPDTRCGKLCSATEKIADPGEAKDAMQRLQDAFAQRVGAGQITGCSALFKESFGGGRFTGVGGACEVERNQTKIQWLICTSDGPHHFYASTGTLVYAATPEMDHTEDQIVEMIQARCTDG